MKTPKAKLVCTTTLTKDVKRAYLLNVLVRRDTLLPVPLKTLHGPPRDNLKTDLASPPPRKIGFPKYSLLLQLPYSQHL